MKKTLNNIKHTNIIITKMVILLTGRKIQAQVTTDIIMIKQHRLNHTNRSITRMKILLTKRTIQVQVTEKRF